MSQHSRHNHRSTKAVTSSVCANVGGLDTFRRLSNAFYNRIERDPLLRTMFPRDSTRRRERLALFLAEVFGGSADYTKKHGKPRLVCSHAPFPIGPAEVRAWLGHMEAAMTEVNIPDVARDAMRLYFAGIAPTLADPLLAFRHLDAKQLEACLKQDPSLVHREDGHGHTLLHAAAGHWDVGRVLLLLDHGARVDVGSSPVCNVAGRYVDRAERSADSGKAAAELLISQGAAVNAAVGPEAQTPLHMAARRGNVAVAKVLLRNGAALEASDTKGETPLRRAVNCGHVEFAAMLLAHGADVNSRDKWGKTSLGAARHADMITLLREHGAVE